MEPRRRCFKVCLLSCVSTFILLLNPGVNAEKKRLYIKTESRPKQQEQQIHHHHYYTITEPMFGGSQAIPMKSRPSADIFDMMKYNRGPQSSRFNHMDFYHDHPVHSEYDHYHDDYDSYPKASRLMRMNPPPMTPSTSYVHHHSPQLDMPEETIPPKPNRPKRMPTYNVSPDIYSREFQRPFFPPVTDKHHNVRHVYTSEIEMDDY